MVLRAMKVGETKPLVILDMDVADVSALGREAQLAQRRYGEYILSCPECGGRVHIRHLAGGTSVIFAHNPGHAKCTVAAGESPQHVFLKTLLYRSAKAVKGYTAALEQPGDGIDPITGRPPVFDVWACRTDRSEPPFAWEVQLGALGEDKLLERHERRSDYLRCGWMTTTRPSWANRVPWNQVNPGTDSSRCLVVDGVWQTVTLRHEGTTSRTEVRSDPFPEQQCAKGQLKGQMYWVEGFGWTWPGNSPPRRRRRCTERAQRPRTGPGVVPTDGPPTGPGQIVG